jgi:CheY-like chemotaxis protein
MKKLGEVYIVDDDQIYTFLLSKQIGRMEFCDTIRVFGHGGEALDELAAYHDQPEKLPDLILLDLNMPVCNGWQFLDRISNLTLQKSIPIDIISSSVSTVEHQKATDYPSISNFYSKPVTQNTLSAILAATQN